MADHAREIENLLYTYAERIDAGNLEGVADLFAHGRILVSADAPPEQTFELYAELAIGRASVQTQTAMNAAVQVTLKGFIDRRGNGHLLGVSQIRASYVSEVNCQLNAARPRRRLENEKAD